MFIPGVVVDSVRLAARVVVHTFDGFQARSASRDGFPASLFQLRSEGGRLLGGFCAQPSFQIVNGLIFDRFLAGHDFPNGKGAALSHVALLN